jgi:hypothetical protein
VRATRRITLAVVGLALIPSGCASSEAPQVAALDNRFDQLDLGSLGEVACDLSYQPGPFDQTGNEFVRQLSLVDESLVPEARETLEDQGFHASKEAEGPYGSVVRFDGPAGMRAGLSYRSAEHEGEVIPFDGSKDCTVPAEGLTTVSP